MRVKHLKRSLAILFLELIATFWVPHSANGIIGGTPDNTTTDIVVALHRPGSRPFCSGSLVAPTWVVTAAHCIWDDTNGRVNDYVGQLRVSTTSGLSGSTASSQIRSVVPHPNYFSWRTGYDIALIKVDDVFGGKFATLATSDEIKSNSDLFSSVIASGFGLTSEGGITSNAAIEISLTLYSQSACAASLPSEILSLSATILCVSGSGSQAVCSGDSGGPLFLITSSGRKLAGATSFGSVPCSASRTKYTNILSYKSFLNTYGIGLPSVGTPQTPTPVVLPQLPNPGALPPLSPIFQTPELPSISGIKVNALPKFSTSRTFQLVLTENSRKQCEVDIDGPITQKNLPFQVFLGKTSKRQYLLRNLNDFGDLRFSVGQPCSLIRKQGIYVVSERSSVKVRVIE